MPLSAGQAPVRSVVSPVATVAGKGGSSPPSALAPSAIMLARVGSAPSAANRATRSGCRPDAAKRRTGEPPSLAATGKASCAQATPALSSVGVARRV